MALNAGDKAECKEIARLIVEKVLEVHIATCPHHQAFLVTKARMVGMALGIVVASGVSSGTVAAIILRFFGG